jgi:hypothetical protein
MRRREFISGLGATAVLAVDRTGAAVGDSGRWIFLSLEPAKHANCARTPYQREKSIMRTFIFATTAIASTAGVCAESLHATYIAKDSDVPRADKPDF